MRLSPRGKPENPAGRSLNARSDARPFGGTHRSDAGVPKGVERARGRTPSTSLASWQTPGGSAGSERVLGGGLNVPGGGPRALSLAAWRVLRGYVATEGGASVGLLNPLKQLGRPIPQARGTPFPVTLTVAPGPAVT